MSKRGVLENQDKAQQFLDFFVSSSISEGDDEELSSLIEEVLSELIRIAPSDRMYFAISGILQERIANPPEVTTPWEDITDNFVDDYLHSDDEDYAVDNPKLPEAMKYRLLSYALGHPADKEKSKPMSDKLLEAIPRPDIVDDADTKMHPIDFVLKLATNFKAPGVRFLQMLGQFIEIPEEYRTRFMDIYDSVKGQSRLSAYETIKKEMPGS